MPPCKKSGPPIGNTPTGSTPKEHSEERNQPLDAAYSRIKAAFERATKP